MTTSNISTQKPKVQGRFRLPDPPEREPGDTTSAGHLSETGLHHHLKQFLGNLDTTIVSGEKYVTASRGSDMRYPDLLVAFGVDPAVYRETNGYVIAEQGKPPDWVLEIASENTADIDVGEKREFYQGLEIPEYWPFDQTAAGEWHGARLAGDLLVDGEYVAKDIEELPDGSLQGYSAALNLYLRWQLGELTFYDPATDLPIASLESERARADTAEARANSAETERNAAETRAAEEWEARLAAEARVRELEERLLQQNP